MVGSHRSLLRAIVTMAGTIMGAGIFGLPAVFVRLGIVRGSLLFWGVALVVCVTHLLFAHIHLVTKNRERLSGFANHYLGPIGGKIASMTYPFHILGTNLVYLLLGGQFLAAIFDRCGLSLPVLNWQALVWIIVAICVLCGVRFLMRLEIFGVWLLVGGMALSVCVLARVPAPAIPLVPAFSPLTSLLGVFLFSLFALPVVGEVVDMVGKKARAAYLSVAIGSLAAAALSWIFAISLARVTPIVPTNAFDLQGLFPSVWWWVIPVVGFLAILTSYLTTALDLFKSFQVDWGFRKDRAWVLALFPPFILLFVAHTTFLSLMNFLGSTVSAINASLVCLIFLFVVRREKMSVWTRWIAPLVPLSIFVFTLVQKLASYFL